MRKARRTPASIVAIAAALASLPTHAIDVQWLGGTGSWIDQSAWSYELVPQDYTKVFIDAYGGMPGSVTYPYPGYTRLGPQAPSSSIAGLDIGANGSLTLLTRLTVTGDARSNGALIGIKSNTLDGSLYVDGKLTLGGQGSTTFQNFNTIRANSLLIEAGHTLQGGGEYIASTVENRGLILATGSLSISPFQYGTSTPVFTNSGVIHVTEGGLFGSGSHQIDNSAGRVDLAGGHFVGFLSGGALEAQGGESKLSGTLRDVTLQGQVQTTGLTLLGEVRNNGVLTLTPLPNQNDGAYLSGSPGTILSGIGTIRTVGTQAARLSNLTLGAGQIFRGSAVFREEFNNQGAMLIEGAEGLTADISPAYNTRLSNSGTIAVTSGSRLLAPTIDNQGGYITLHEGASIGSHAQDGRITGGTVNGHLATLGNITFADLTLEGQWRATSSSKLGVAGNIVLDGELEVGRDSDSYTYLTLHGNTQFTGKGQTRLFSSTHWSSQIRSDGMYWDGNYTLTLGAEHVLTGTGIIDVTTVNQGLIRSADSERLQFNRAWTNEGSVQILDGGAIGSAAIDNSRGMIDIANGGALTTFGHGGPSHGGVILGGGERSTITGAFRDVTLAGTLSSGGGITVSGNITNVGRLILGNSEQNGGGAMTIDGQATLRGTGLTEIRDGKGYAMLRGESGSSASLTVASDHRVIASGVIADLSVRNQGRVDVAQGELRLYRSALQNEGRLSVAHGALLSSDSEITAQGRRALTTIDGVLETPLLKLVDGATLRGTGTIKGDAQTQAAQIMLDAASGGLAITGNLILDEDSTLSIHGLGHPSADTVQLAAGGDVTLGGLLLLTFDSQAKLGDSFDLLLSGGELSGTFSDLQILGLGTDLKVSLAYTTHGVSASLISAVPEASTMAQWALGLACIGATGLRRRRRKPSC